MAKGLAGFLDIIRRFPRSDWDKASHPSSIREFLFDRIVASLPSTRDETRSPHHFFMEAENRLRGDFQGVKVGVNFSKGVSIADDLRLGPVFRPAVMDQNGL